MINREKVRSGMVVGLTGIPADRLQYEAVNCCCDCNLRCNILFIIPQAVALSTLLNVEAFLGVSRLPHTLMQ